MVHRRADLPLCDITLPTLRAIASGPITSSWSTGKLGVVVSTIAAVFAVVVDVATPMPRPITVLAVMVGAFAVSWRATARRPYRSRGQRGESTS